MCISCSGIASNRLFFEKIGGKSGLQVTMQGVTPLRRKTRTSGTERRSRAMITDLGTGEFVGAAGVKTAKLCMEQDQIGERLSRHRKLSGKVAKEIK